MKFPLSFFSVAIPDENIEMAPMGPNPNQQNQDQDGDQDQDQDQDQDKDKDQDQDQEQDQEQYFVHGLSEIEDESGSENLDGHNTSQEVSEIDESEGKFFCKL